MSKHIFSLALALGFLGAASVSAQQPQQPQQPRQPQQPSTSPTEGTAADRTSPGQTPTQDAMPQQPVDPRPSTSPAEGTAADRTPPGRTPTTTDPSGERGQQMGDKQMRDQQMGQQMGDKAKGREIVGASVVSETQAPVGRVVDVVFSASNQPEFVVIESEGKQVAVPYSVANANMSANKIVIDESRLQSAPKMKQGEWRSKTEGTWKRDATRYWERDQG